MSNSQPKLNFLREPRITTRSMENKKSPSKGEIPTSSQLTVSTVHVTPPSDEETENQISTENTVAAGNEPNPSNPKPNAPTGASAGASAHTLLSEEFKAKSDDPYEEENIAGEEIEGKHILKYKIYHFPKEGDLPPFVHSTQALQYFRVLRDMIFDNVRAKHHEKEIKDSRLSDQAPPGMRIRKNIEVVGSTPLLRLQALQIYSEAETKMTKVIQEHYKVNIPKMEKEFMEIFKSMKRITVEEKVLINMKLLHYKNELMRAHKERGNKKGKPEPAAKNDETPSTSKDQPTFPWNQKQQRQPRAKQRARKNLMSL